MRILHTESGGILIEVTAAAFLAAFFTGTVLLAVPGIGDGVARGLRCVMSGSACGAALPSRDQVAAGGTPAGAPAAPPAIDLASVGDTGAPQAPAALPAVAPDLLFTASAVDGAPLGAAGGVDALQQRHGGVLVAGPAQLGAQGAAPEFGVSDLDLDIGAQTPQGDPATSAGIGGALAASDCWYFGAGGVFGPTGTLSCALFSGVTGAFSASAASRAGQYQGGEFDPSTRYCIPGRGCFVAGQGTIDPGELTGGLAAALPECPFGYSVKGPVGCAIAVGQGVLAYGAGVIQPKTEWTWQPSTPSGSSVDDPLAAPAVRYGSQRAVAGLGTAAPLALTWGTDYKILGEAATTGIVLGGVRAFAVTGNPLSALINAGMSGLGYALGSSADQVVTVSPMSPQETAALEAEIAEARNDLAALEAEPTPVPGPNQYVTPQLLEGLKYGERLVANPAELDLRLSPVDIARFREVRRQIRETDQDIASLAALEVEPTPAPGPDQYVTPELLQGLIAGLRDQDLEARLSALRQQERDLLSAGGSPQDATIVQLVPGGPGQPAVYEQRSGSAVVCRGGRVCLGKFSIVDGEVVELEPVPGGATPAPGP